MQARKVRVADIERLRQNMENVPEHPAEEVTTAEAVRRPSPRIHAMNAKGYGLPAIAELLNDNGPPMTTKTLETYLRLDEATAEGGRKNRRKANERRPATGAAAMSLETESKPAMAAHAAASDAEHAARVVPRMAPTVTTPPTPSTTPAAAKWTPGTTRPGDEADMHRSAFLPKVDARDA